MQSLDVSNNCLRVIPPAIAHLPKLTELLIDGNEGVRVPQQVGGGERVCVWGGLRLPPPTFFP